MRFILPLILAFFVAAPAFATFQGPGSTPQATTAAQASNLADDSIVTLTGNIISKVEGTKDKYMFRDSSGEIRVEIDHKYFPAQEITPKNTVRIMGEVDKDFGKPTEIDVKRVEIIN